MIRRRAFGLAVLGAAIAGAIVLSRHGSAHAVVLGRYSAAYAAVLAGWLAATAVLAWVVLGRETRYRAVFNPNLALALACTALMLAASELVLRRVDHGLVRTFPPGVSTRTTTMEYDVEMTTNREGFRDVEHTRQKPDGVFRVALIGDSFVAGSGVAFDSTFGRRLQGLLSSGGRRVEVLNFGVSGTGPVHDERVWRRFASRYRPDLVLECLYAGNDASDALRESSAHGPRLMTVALARRLLSRLTRHGPAPAAGTTPAGARGWNAFGIDNPARMDALLAAARARGVPADTVRARLAAIPDSLVADARAFRSNPFNLAEAVLDPDALRDNLLLSTDDLQRGWARIEDALRTLQAGTRRAGTRLVLVCIPAGPQVDRRYWWASRLGMRLDDRVLTETVFQDRLSRFARGQGMSLIDLLPAMRAHPDEVLYYERDGHWNARGHEVAARAIAAVLDGSMQADGAR